MQINRKLEIKLEKQFDILETEGTLYIYPNRKRARKVTPQTLEHLWLKITEWTKEDL